MRNPLLRLRPAVRDESFACLDRVRDSDVAGGDMTADAATHFADRLACHFCSGVVASAARFGAKRDARRENPAKPTARARFCTLNGTNRNSVREQRLAMKIRSRLRVICATPFQKRPGLAPFQAVPLLRVQKPSVIVMLRRRGASRGRPVRWFA